MAAGNSRRKQEVQRCQSQLVSTDSMFSLEPVFFFTEVVQTVATAMNATGGADTTPTRSRADAHFSGAHITVHNSLIDPHALAQGSRDQCRAFLKKTLSSLRHVLVRFAFHSFPSCRFISYFFSVTTFSVDNIIGDQIKPLLLCSLEWNVWLLGQSDSSHSL